MSRVAANLTPLLFCPAFLLWHALGAALCIPACVYAWVAADPATGGYVATFILPAWAACVLTSLQRDLMIRPFSFCLPGHRTVLRSTSFLVGIAVSLVACLPVLDHPGLDGMGLLWAVWSAFCFGLIVYLVIVGFLFLVNSVVVLSGPFMVMGAVLIEFQDTRILVQEVALFAPGWNTAILAALSVITWRRMGSVDHARWTCGRRFLSLQRTWRRSAAEEFGASGKLASLSRTTWSVRDRLLQRLFARIGRRPALSLRRHLAATQYELAGRLVPLSAWSAPIAVLAYLVLLAAAGYAPVREDRPEVPVANALYVGSCLLAMQLAIPMFTTMLQPAGRRERFWGALAIAACSGLAVLGTSLLIYVLLLGMGAVAPPLSMGGETYVFRPADLELAFVPLALLPLSMLLKVTCKKWLLVPEILLFGTTMLVIIKGGAVLRELNALEITVPLSVSWALLVLVLYSYCFRRDLVRG